MDASESVIRLMTRLAVRHQAVNLSQGFTDEAAVYEMVWGGIAATLGGTAERMQRLETLTLRETLDELDGDLDSFLSMTLKAFLGRLQGARDQLNQYSFPFGLLELREAISSYTARFYDFRPDPDTEITVSLGATEGFASVLRAVCAPGDGVVIFQPFHEMYPSQAHLFGLRPQYVTLGENPRAGTWDMNREELDAAARRGARALILNSPHNPTAKVFSKDELHFIAQLCRRYDLLAITDEIYEHIVYDNHRHLCLGSFDEMRERTIIVNAISKTGNATGWRVGWVISPPAYTTSIRAIHDTLVVQAPTPLQKGAERLLQLDDQFYAGLREAYRKKRDTLMAGLERVGFRVTLPQGSYYLFANYREVPALHDLPPMDAARFLIEKVGVAAVPGNNFYQVGNDGDRYLRFAFCRGLDTLQEATRRLAALERYTS